MKISILGMGYIGLPTSIILALNGHDINGFDVNETVVDSLNSGRIHIREEGLQETFSKVITQGNFRVHGRLQEADVYIVAVPTPFKRGSDQKIADLSYVECAAREIAGILKYGDLVILESTVPPTTTRRMTDILEEQSGLARDSFYTAHCPERVLPGNILHELENNDRVIGAEREASAHRAKELYATFVTSGNIYLTDDVTAETCKLVENAYRDVNIAFANELSILSNDLGIDVTDLIHLANKHPRVNILNPGVGVGGHCIAVDPWFLVERFPENAKLIRQARETNDFKPCWTADLIEGEVNHEKSTVIGILGLAYKPNIDDLRESPSICLAHLLADRGYPVIACEPNVSEEAVEGIMLYDLDTILNKADFVVMTLSHIEFLDRIGDIKQVNNIIL
jgi:UDP-N-acetyl-D-mannosaminuronic acid dehydrogenase